MRTKFYKISILAAIAMMTIVSGCKDLLNEEPKTALTADYLKTPQGIQQAINAAYATMRFHYGTNGPAGVNHQGTDEWTFASEPRSPTAGGDNLGHRELGSYTLTANQIFLNTPFNRTFPFINLCNGIVEFAEEAGLTAADKAAVLAEARYLRAHYYMILVTQFGAVPLDFGSGELKFNTVPFYGFNRLPQDELLGKNFQAMIDDLNFAKKNLPEQRPAAQFKLSQSTALHLLSKIFLFRAYSAHAQPTDFDSAYYNAMELINNKVKYGVELQQDFADVFKQGNDYNSEILYAVERLPRDNNNNQIINPVGIGELENHLGAFFTCQYTLAQYSGVNLIDGRVLEYGRELRKISPTGWLLHTAFADKVNDSRYHNTFRTMWLCASVNDPTTQAYEDYVANLAGIGKAIGDTALYLTDTQAEADALEATVDYDVLGPDEWYVYPNFTRNIYPSLKKYADSDRGFFNDVSGRPTLVHRFAETYLLAAEAAFQMGDGAEAARLINIIRERAAYRPSRPGLNEGQNNTANANAALAMQVDAGDIDLDFILDERSRELCGENNRWPDLAMRGETVFLGRIQAHNPDAAPNVDAHHRLRPIPQAQLDAVQYDGNDLDLQNPGYSE